MIRKLTSSQWSAAGFGLFLIALTLTIGFISHHSVQLQSTTAGWVDHTHLVLDESDKVLSELKDAETGQRGFLITGEEAYLSPYNNGTAALPASLAELRHLTADNPRQQHRLDVLAPLISAKLEELRATVDLRRDKGFEAARQVVLTDKGKAVMEQIRATIAEMNGEETALMATRKADADATKKRAVDVILFGTLLSAASALFLTACLIFVARINNALDRTVLELSTVADEVMTASTEVARSNQALAQSATQQAASIQDTSASTEQINSMARRNTENSASTATIVAASQASFVTTSNQLEEMVVAMEEMNTSSEKISKIIKVIDGIAFQTNILALNAAVEAARAGEAGLGFAVVADEVRNLAQRSAQAAMDTTALIEDSNTKSRRSKAQVGEVAVAIRSLTGESLKIKALVDQINEGSQEQARGIALIGRAVSQMEKLTQSAAASAEQSAAAAEQLSGQSQTLTGVVGEITSLIGKS